MLFLLFNITLFIVSLLLTYFSMLQFNVFLTLPTSLQILIGLGLITPVMNLYDTIRTFVSLITIMSETKDEDNL